MDTPVDPLQGLRDAGQGERIKYEYDWRQRRKTHAWAWGGPKERFWTPETFDAFDNIDGLVLSKEGLSLGTFGGLSFEEI